MVLRKTSTPTGKCEKETGEKDVSIENEVKTN
jgi:hypothetical protein